MCELALKDDASVKPEPRDTEEPRTVTKALNFDYNSHDNLKLDLVQCPVFNRYIYESRREKDCYFILFKEEILGDAYGYLYIRKEICGLGLM